ncbi:hypothetical protein BCU43_004710 [Vibrio lentus]
MKRGRKRRRRVHSVGAHWREGFINEGQVRRRISHASDVTHAIPGGAGEGKRRPAADGAWHG